MDVMNGKNGLPVLSNRAVFAVIFGFALLASVPFWYTQFVISTRGVPAYGWITNRMPDQHRTVEFRFVAAGRTYTGKDSPTQAGIGAFETFDVGDTVPVTYAAGTPQYARLGDQRGTFLGAYLPFLGCALAASVLAALVNAFRRAQMH